MGAGILNFTYTFGKHVGKTFEKVFFDDPGYVWWLIETDIHNSPKFSPLAKARFEQLVRRAKHLKIPGVCSWCKQKPITRMFLTRHPSGGLARVDFDCETCHPYGSSQSVALKPSFFTPDFYKGYDKTGAKFLVTEIKRAFFKNPSYRLTQKNLETFFNEPNNFENY